MELTLLNERRNNRLYTDGTYVYKIFRKGYNKEDVFLEAYVTSLVESLGLRVPVFNEVSLADECWKFKYPYFKGTSMYDLMQANPDKIDEYLDLFVEIQTDIHKRRCPQLPVQKEKMSRYIKLSNLDKGLKLDLVDMLNSSPKHRKVCHGNFTPHNVIINEEGDYQILDWNHSSQGNASADVARSYLWMNINMPQIADRYLAKFCDATSTSSQYVKNWIPIVAAARLYKNIPEEIKFLTSLISVVEY